MGTIGPHVFLIGPCASTFGDESLSDYQELTVEIVAPREELGPHVAFRVYATSTRFESGWSTPYFRREMGVIGRSLSDEELGASLKASKAFARYLKKQPIQPETMVQLVAYILAFFKIKRCSCTEYRDHRSPPSSIEDRDVEYILNSLKERWNQFMIRIGKVEPIFRQ